MKRTYRLLSMLLVLVMCLGMFTAFTSAATVVKNGSQGTTVRYVQYNLNVLGFNCGTADGICGSKTVSAIKSYQRARKLDVDGMAGPATQSKLTSEVKEIQKLLKKYGWYSDSVDGVAGPNTITGVKKFQKAAGMSQTGALNDAAVKKLRNWPDNKVTLNIGSGSYNPKELQQGSSYSISGKITSNYKITAVTVGVYDSNGRATAQVKTVNPNTTSYDINKVDNSIKFGSLSAGTYYFKVIAKASSTEKVLVNNKFTVKKVQPDITGAVSTGSVPPAGAIFIHQTPQHCTAASAAMLLKAYLYINGKNYSYINERTIRTGNASPKDTWDYGLKTNITLNRPNDKNIDGIRMKQYTLSGTAVQKRDKIASVLKTHPEGVVLYGESSSGAVHAVYMGANMKILDPFWDTTTYKDLSTSASSASDTWSEIGWYWMIVR